MRNSYKPRVGIERMALGWAEIRRRERQRRIVLLVLLALAGVAFGLSLAFSN